VCKVQMSRKNKIIIFVLAFLFIIIFVAVGSISFKKSGYKFNENEVMYVNGEVVTVDEYIYYLEKGKEYYEVEAGEEIWDMDIDGTSAFETLKQRIIETIREIKLQVSVAKKMGIEVEDSEVDRYIASTKNSKKDKKYIMDQFYIDKLKKKINEDIIVTEDSYSKKMNEWKSSSEYYINTQKIDSIFID